MITGISHILDDRGAAAIGIIALGLALSIAACAFGVMVNEYGRYSYAVKVTNEIIAQRAGERLDISGEGTSLTAVNVGSVPSMVVGILIRKPNGELEASRIEPVGVSVLENTGIPLHREVSENEIVGVLTAFGNVYWTVS